LGCRRDKKRAYRKTPKGRAALARERGTERSRAARYAQKKRRIEKIKADPALYEAYREKQRQRRKRYTSTPSGKACQRRKSFFKEEKIRLATPAWCDKSSLNQFLVNCPDGHHVDHIIPLRGEFVWGLNIPENLQYLPAQENIYKNNKIDPLTLEANICVLPGYRSYIKTPY
jgi:hypothetical protein